MSEPAELTIRMATPGEQRELEALQRRASLALGEYNQQLEAEPDAIQLPVEQIERGEVIVAELGDRQRAVQCFGVTMGNQACPENLTGEDLGIEPAERV